MAPRARYSTPVVSFNSITMEKAENSSPVRHSIATTDSLKTPELSPKKRLTHIDMMRLSLQEKKNSPRPTSKTSFSAGSNSKPRVSFQPPRVSRVSIQEPPLTSPSGRRSASKSPPRVSVAERYSLSNNWSAFDEDEEEIMSTPSTMQSKLLKVAVENRKSSAFDKMRISIFGGGAEEEVNPDEDLKSALRDFRKSKQEQGGDSSSS